MRLLRSMMANTIVLIVGVSLLIPACGGIKHSQEVAQPTNVTLVAGVGDSIVDIDKKESMPNAFGQDDIFGRTRPTGRTIVIYMGMEQGRAVLERQNISISSNATTMNSTPIVVPRNSTTNYQGNTSIYGSSPSGSFSGNAFSSGTATTNAPPIILPPTGSQTQILSNDRMRLYLDLNESKSIFVEGKKISIISATASMLKYKILN